MIATLRRCKGGDTRETYSRCRWCGLPIGTGGQLCCGSPEQQAIDALKCEVADLKERLKKFEEHH